MQLDKDTATMAPTAVGAELATKVAKKLPSSKDTSYRHRDYCSIGLNSEDGKYVMGDCQDGHPCLVRGASQSWSTEDEFVTWLAAQSDHTLGNQRITLERLTAFLNIDLEDGYSECR